MLLKKPLDGGEALFKIDTVTGQAWVLKEASLEWVPIRNPADPAAKK